MTGLRRLCTIAALAAVASPVGAATAARPTSARTTPKVLHVVATGYSIALTPTEVGAARYTVQVHNIGQYAVRVTMGGEFSVLVPRGGWQFRDVLFKAGKTYKIHAVAPLGHLVWDAAITAQ